MQDTRKKNEPEERPEENTKHPKIALMAIVITALLVLIIASGRSCGTDTKRASTGVEVSQTSITTENGGVSEESTWGAETTQQTLEQTSSTTKLTTTTKATATTTTAKATTTKATTTKATTKKAAVVTQKKPVVTQKATTKRTTATPPVYIANVIGKTQAGAVSLLKEQGLLAQVKTAYHSENSGTVYSQTPAAGTSVSSGSTVTIYVSKGKQPVYVQFSGNGGSVGITGKTVYATSSYGTLPTPTRSYYTFKGWYTASSGGTKVSASTVVTNTSTHTLYAQWTQNEVSGWVLSSSVPSGAQIVSQKWTYNKTEKTTSSSSSKSGWTRTGVTWNKTGSGTHYYASFPSGYNTGDGYYSSYAKSALSSYNNGSTKRDVSGASWKSYVYWHWTYPLSSYNNQTFDRYIEPTYNASTPRGRTTLWYAFESTTNYPEVYAGTYKAQISAYQASSYWWYRVSVYQQTYTDYSATYTYERTTTGLTSYSAVSAGNGISNVQKWVTYRKK